MDGEALTVTDGAPAGAWIAKRMTGDAGAVNSCVPDCFDAYARILHPPVSRDGLPTSWAHVAEVLGRTTHSLVQWHALVGSKDPFSVRGSEWDGEGPLQGDLSPSQSATLRGVLADYTIGSNRCFFGLWTGWDWVESGNVRVNAKRLGKGDRGRVYIRADREADSSDFAFSPRDLDHSFLRLPGRAYLVLAGPLSAAAQIGDPSGLDGFTVHSANLIWPTSRSWFVSSEIDFDSTLVGGSAELIDRVLNTPGLEAWPVRLKDRLTCDADRINQHP